MAEAVSVFVVGITGVFIGMAALYLFMKILSLVTNRKISEEESK